MKVILLSGGSGKRLWPLSNDSRSKQFLRVLPGPDGKPESMVQRVWRQLQESDLGHHSYILTGKAQAEIIHNQLGHDVPLILEPERRDTFAAIVLAASYLHSHGAAHSDELVVVMPVDPYVDVSFMHELRRLEASAKNMEASLLLMGVKPTHPSEKYGYILPYEQAASSHGRLSVKGFVEKPEEAKAASLIEQGALWNCGVFAGKLNFFIDQLMVRGFPVEHEELLQNYSRLPKRSFDYEVVEKLAQIDVVTYEGYWKDLGTWNTLIDEMEGNVKGKGVLSHDSMDSYIVNELDIPVAVLGVSNVIVAASPDGILVTDKAASPRIKEILDPNQGVPMYEERYWGWYKIIDYLKLPDGREVMTKRIYIEAGKNLSYHHHEKRSETWIVLSGCGELIQDGIRRRILQGDVIQTSIGTLHAVQAQEDLDIIETQIGSELMEEDIFRQYLHWKDIIND